MRRVINIFSAWILVFSAARAAEVWHSLGLLPELSKLILHNFDLLDIGRLKQVNRAFNRYLSSIKVDWMESRRLSHEERLIIINALKTKDRAAIKTVLGNAPAALNFDYGPDLSTRSILTDAIKYSSLEILRLLVNHGLRLNDFRYLYALENCMACKKLDMFRFLLANNPDVHLISGASRILCNACENSIRALQAEEIRYFLENYAVFRSWINAARYEQPIHVARNLEILRLLLEFGADPNSRRSIDLRTKLHLVMFETVRERPEKIKCLMEAGADSMLLDKNGQTAIELLIDNVPDVESVELMMSTPSSTVVEGRRTKINLTSEFR